MGWTSTGWRGGTLGTTSRTGLQLGTPLLDPPTTLSVEARLVQCIAVAFAEDYRRFLKQNALGRQGHSRRGEFSSLWRFPFDLQGIFDDIAQVAQIQRF